METKLALSFFLFGKLQPLIDELKETLGTAEPIMYNSFLEPQDLVSAIDTVENTIIIFCVESKEDSVKVLEALKLSKQHILNKRIRFAGFNVCPDKTVEEALKKAGCRDLLSVKEAQAKKLKFKIALWKKMLKAPLEGSVRSASSSASPSEVIPASEGAAKAEAPKAEAPKVTQLIGHRKELVDALQIAKDVWSYKGDQDCDYQKNLWTLKLEGPSAKNVFWDKSSKVIGGWEMFYSPSMPSDQKDKTGSWICLGDKPTFIQAEGKWLFKGAYITLTFSSKSDEFVKVETKDKVIRIAKTDYAAKKPQEASSGDDKNSLPKVGSTPAAGTVQKQAGTSNVVPLKAPQTQEQEIKRLTQTAKIAIRLVPVVNGKDDVANAKDCALDDCFENELTLLIGKGQFVKASKYKVVFIFESGDYKLSFILDCSLDEKTEYDEEKEMLIFFAEKIDQKKMEEFMTAYSQRQSNISEFLKVASGRD